MCLPALAGSRHVTHVISAQLTSARSDNVEVQFTHGNPRIMFFNDFGDQVGACALRSRLIFVICCASVYMLPYVHSIPFHGVFVPAALLSHADDPSGETMTLSTLDGAGIDALLASKGFKKKD